MTQDAASARRPDGRSVRLWRVLVLLATSAEEESEKSPATPVRAENLAIEFDEAYTDFVEGFDHLPSESQLLALQAVDTKLATMVRAKDAALWTVRALREDPCWSEVRALAQRVIGEFDWPQTLV